MVSGFFGLFFKRLFGAREQYMTLSVQNAQESKRLGVMSIVSACLGTVLTVAFVVFGSLCTDNFLSVRAGDGEPRFPVLSLIGIIAFFGIAVILYCSLVLRSLSYAVYQRKLNALGIGKAALAVSLTAVFATLIASVIIILVIAG